MLFWPGILKTLILPGHVKHMTKGLSTDSLKAYTHPRLMSGEAGRITGALVTAGTTRHANTI